MKIKHLVAAVAVCFGVAGMATTTSAAQPASAVTTSNKNFRKYKTMPKALRGTWQTKGYTKYRKGIKSNATYQFNKNSYTLIMKFKGGSVKSKTIHFPKNQIGGMWYEKQRKVYDVFPGGKMSDAKKAYASYLTLKPVRRNGKRALALYPIGGTKMTYFYRK